MLLSLFSVFYNGFMTIPQEQNFTKGLYRNKNYGTKEAKEMRKELLLGAVFALVAVTALSGCLQNGK